MATTRKKMIAPKAAPLLPPPSGHPSWLAYVVATMETRRLYNEHAFGHQPHWPAEVTREQMRSAVEAELKVVESHWREMERAWAGEIETAAVAAKPAAMVRKRRPGQTMLGKATSP